MFLHPKQLSLIRYSSLWEKTLLKHKTFLAHGWKLFCLTHLHYSSADNLIIQGWGLIRILIALLAHINFDICISPTSRPLPSSITNFTSSETNDMAKKGELKEVIKGRDEIRIRLCFLCLIQYSEKSIYFYLNADSIEQFCYCKYLVIFPLCCLQVGHGVKQRAHIRL